MLRHQKNTPGSLLKKWLTPEKGVGQNLEKLCVESMLEGMEEAERRWIRERDPKSADETADYMRLYRDSRDRRYESVSRISVSERRELPAKSQMKMEGVTPKSAKKYSEVTCYN